MGVEAWIALLSAVISAGSVAVVGIMQARAKINADQQKAKMDDRDKIIERQEKEIKRQGEQILQQQEAIRELWEIEKDCEVDLGVVHEFAAGQYRAMVSMSAILKKLGHDPGDIGKAPIRPQRHRSKAQAEFRVRTTEQNTGLLVDQDPETSQ